MAIVEFYAAANLDHVVAGEGIGDRGEVIPHFRGDGSGAVSEFELKPGRAGARRSANFFFAHEEKGSDGLPVLQGRDKKGFHQLLSFGFIFFFVDFCVVSVVGATS